MATLGEAGPHENERVYTVSEVTARIKVVVESSLPVFWVEGEISNFVHHRSGHMYFTLKDAKSQLPCVMFRSRNTLLRFLPENGMRVVAWGRIRVYEPGGRYQLYVERMKPGGVGALAVAFERLKRRLEAEGLFDPARKKPIPRFPGTVAVVTSPTGAAVHDVVRVIRSRYPAARIVVVPTQVQGSGAVDDIVRALGLVDRWGEADVAIVGRGGGSLEDLGAFNEEKVVRAIAEAETPIVSAVGHEIDFTISDFAADVRAATPSNAAELVVPDRAELSRAVGSLRTRLVNAIRRHMRRLQDRLTAYRYAYGLRAPRDLVERLAVRLDELTGRLAAAVTSRLSSARAELARAKAELRLVDPSHILARGFATVSLLPELVTVRSVAQVEAGSEVRVRVSDGAFDCTVRSVREAAGRNR